jgi:hypothetical protein
VPGDPPEIASQLAFAVAVQVHELAEAVTPTLAWLKPVPPEVSVKSLVGESVYVHGDRPGCVTVKVWLLVWLPTVMVPVRVIGALLAVAVKEIVPLPVPEMGGVRFRKDAPLLAVQAQDGSDAVNAKLPVPPP